MRGAEGTQSSRPLADRQDVTGNDFGKLTQEDLLYVRNASGVSLSAIGTNQDAPLLCRWQWGYGAIARRTY
jgi:hypothetical protein